MTGHEQPGRAKDDDEEDDDDVMASGAMMRVAVLGAGGWGTALAVHLARTGKAVSLWGRDASLMAVVAAERVNATYLPGVDLPSGVRPTASLEEALAGVSCVVAAVPSHGIRDVIRAAAPWVSAETIVVSATKGLELETLLRMSEVIGHELGNDRRVAVLSGPSFALEVARGAPTAVSVAGRSKATVVAVQEGFHSPYFRLYGSADVIGVEIGGALKNIIAIAAGTVESLGLGDNARSALITRGLAEMSRLASAVGGRRDTLFGLSGLGDLVLTCTGELSRNRRIGIELGRGRPLEDVLSGMRTVAEGVRTTTAALELSTRCGVELPIAAQMEEVLAGRKPPRAAVEELMLRRQRSEIEAMSE